MSDSTAIVERYLDGFRRHDHAQILSCLTDDIEWTVSGASRITRKPAYDVAIELPGEATRHTGDVLRMSMAEVFVMRDGLIAERRAG
jgi:ketosteroid isomerase-like protein